MAGKEMRAVMTAKDVGDEVGTERFVCICVEELSWVETQILTNSTSGRVDSRKEI